MIIDIRAIIATDTPAVTDADEFELMFSAEKKKSCVYNDINNNKYCDTHNYSFQNNLLEMCWKIKLKEKN